METIRVVFENGVFRPLIPVSLPEQAEFEVEPRPVVSPSAENDVERRFGTEEGMRKVYAILSERFDSGFSDTAARHNEHQP
jgi:predicted DNA-binding antitoxin AbrB/MazE fold protein